MTVSLVTGANKGIGHEVARQLIALGHTVYLGARDEQRGRAAAAGLGARFVQLDVRDAASVARAAASVEGTEEHLDVLVNNAGIAPSAPFDPDDASAVFDTNVVGIIRVTQAFLPLLRRAADPVVVNVASSLGSFGVVTDPERRQSRFASGSYGASKAAVSMLTVQYAKAEQGVRFHAVEPGFTATDLGGGTPAGRPVEVSAQVVVRLATTGSDGPSGTLLDEDGRLPW